tara:strand:- start:99 stop:764 length:666 start_codon:yes stop_codon:yes gene_type:complete
MSVLIKAENISKYYKENRILDNVNFSLNEKEIVSILGPSGSGKTSLLNILGLLDKEYEGNITIDNHNISKTKKLDYIRRNYIGFIFQFHHLLPEFTIFENLLIPLYYNNQTKDEKYKLVDEKLDLLDIKHLKNKFPDEISGGECQRVAIIRSIINKPKIILADEPTGNLDQKNSKNVIKLLYKLKLDYSISIVIATHDDNVVSISDRIINIENRKLNIMGN